MVNKDLAKPLYLQIVEIFENRIATGELKPGDRIPSEGELTEEFKVSIITVRRAISELYKEGLMDKQQGRGTYVRSTGFVRDSSALMSFTEACRMQGAVPGAKLIKSEKVVLNKKNAEALGLAEGSEGIFISRLRFADDVPVVLENSWFGPAYRFILDEDFNDASLFAYLKEEKGITISRSDKDIDLCYAYEDEAELLQVPEGSPLIRVKSLAFDQKGEALYVGNQIMNGNRFRLRIRQGR